jgi:hypothetical protein
MYNNGKVMLGTVVLGKVGLFFWDLKRSLNEIYMTKTNL